VIDHPRPAQREYHQNDSAPALGPRRTAEERPPHNEYQSAEERCHHPSGKSLESRDYGFHSKPCKPLQCDDNHAGPQPQRLPVHRISGVLVIYTGFMVSHNNSLHLKLPELAAAETSMLEDRARTLRKAFFIFHRLCCINHK
jgi:hypothetical protein